MPSNNEKLMQIIRENDNPEQAILVAVEIITSFLGQSVSYQEPSADFLQALD